MKVFGIGLNKTGTSSLGSALQILGYQKRITFDPDLTRSWYNKDYKTLYRAADQNDCFEDWPWPMIYKELYEKYSDAKFILTTRISSEKWFNSLLKHSLRGQSTEFRKMVYGYDWPNEDKEAHIKFYEKHNREVIEFFNMNAPEKLLTVCWEKGEGWNELCNFLEKPIPAIEFPTLNPSGSYLYMKLKQITKKLIKRK